MTDLDTRPSPAATPTLEQPVYRPLHARPARPWRRSEVAGVAALLLLIAAALVALGFLMGWQPPDPVIGIDTTPRHVTTTTSTVPGRASSAGAAPARGATAIAPRATLPSTGPAPHPSGGTAGAPVGDQARPAVVTAPSVAAAAEPATTVPPAPEPVAPATTTTTTQRVPVPVTRPPNTAPPTTEPPEPAAPQPAG